MGRCLRDMAGATQHVLVDANSLVGVAPALLADWKNGAIPSFDIGHDVEGSAVLEPAIR